MELTLIIEEWLRRVPDFELATEEVPEIVFPANTFGLGSLRLRY
jgi:hypothetical protein